MAFSITLNQNFNSISIMVKDNKIFGQLPAKKGGGQSILMSIHMMNSQSAGDRRKEYNKCVKHVEEVR